MSNMYDSIVMPPEGSDTPLNYGQTLNKYLGGHKSAEEWQAFYAAQAKVNVVIEQDADGNEVEVVRTLSGRRPRGSVRKAFDAEELQEVLAEFDGGMKPLDIAAKRNVQPPVVYTFLKAEGRVIKKGRKPGSVVPRKVDEATGEPSKPFGRARSTRLEMSAEEIDEAVVAFHAGKGMVALASEYNVPPPLMKEYLTAKGCVIKKGKRKAVVLDLDSNPAPVVA